MIPDNIIIYLLVVLNIILVGLGYLLGRLHTGNTEYVYNTSNKKNNSIAPSKTSIQINEEKFVTDIRTDNIEKKFETLGDTKTSEENISSAINKLKNMKG
jgi:hypothetical protein